jgi:hypothetical protein
MHMFTGRLPELYPRAGEDSREQGTYLRHERLQATVQTLPLQGKFALVISRDGPVTRQ